MLFQFPNSGGMSLRGAPVRVSRAEQRLRVSLPVRAVLLSVPAPRRLYRAGECLHFLSCFPFYLFPLSSPCYLGNLEKDYVLGTDRTAHVEHYWRYANDRLRKKLEAQGITVTGSYSTSKAGKYCWVGFNLKEIVEIKKV
jgi:hypothetical protein